VAGCLHARHCFKAILVGFAEVGAAEELGWRFVDTPMPQAVVLLLLHPHEVPTVLTLILTD
jgi:hypothetical protein